jgi:hypothetical protein
VSRAWELRKNEVLLGIVVADSHEEYPWINCTFEATREFQPYWQLFAEEARLLIEVHDGDGQQQLTLYQQEIKEMGLSLVHFGKPKIVENFILHIHGGQARLRIG